MTSAAARGRAVRERLLAAAVELIPERGWTAVSTRVLADRAGVTPSVVHYHFPTLQALLREAVIGMMRQVMTDVDTLLDTARTPVRAVEALLASVDQYTGADPVSLLFVEAYLAAGRDEELRGLINGVIDGFRKRFGQWLHDRGVLAAEETAAVVLACVDGLLLHRGLGSSPDIQSVIAAVCRLVTSGGRS
ncbi:TetR/AcrR family transcriptional regulator [Actinocrispum wychmicini]|uniref:TetR family transcriptional regulator n=1 Tax=Actinocrispum wychmicini TaxID=1213861 RepID=A0A4R2JMH1_9PSEU|nr:TetR/AcrR family transcriptional regulator [Actinocrispum wychmicini]TCO58316.1 TetR family transcriptional regulator [Actinocrispum wychmicini]